VPYPQRHLSDVDMVQCEAVEHAAVLPAARPRTRICQCASAAGAPAARGLAEPR